MSSILNPTPIGKKPFKIGLFILMEDESSNFYYLQDKIKYCNLNPNNILYELKNSSDIGNKTQANRIVAETLKLVANRNAALKERIDEDADTPIDYVPFTEIYCVIDLDHNHLEPKTGDSHLAQAQNAIQTAQVRGINIALILSNECFEIWYILHFQDINEPLYRKNSKNKAQIRTDKTNSIEFLQNQYLGRNSKKFKYYFNKITEKGGSETNAITRAKALATTITHTNPLHNPSTDMYILIERLNEFVTG
jgi:RloB-like protein